MLLFKGKESISICLKNKNHYVRLAVEDLQNDFLRVSRLTAAPQLLDEETKGCLVIEDNPYQGDDAVCDESFSILCDGEKITLSANTYKTITITYMIPKSNSKGSYNCDLFLAAGGLTDFTADARIRSENLVADGQFHTLTINLSGNSYWSGNIHKLRFDFFEGCAVGDVMFVKSIVLS